MCNALPSDQKTNGFIFIKKKIVVNKQVGQHCVAQVFIPENSLAAQLKRQTGKKCTQRFFHLSLRLCHINNYLNMRSQDGDFIS